MMQFPDKRKGFCCPTCQQLVKEYSRSFNANMAIAAITMYLHKPNEFVKVEDLLIEKGHKRCGDFSYLKHFGIIEPLKGKREDGSNRNGYYRLTAKGCMFVEGKIKVPSKFVVFNNNLEGFEGEEITINQALGEKFNYEKLMSA